MDLLVEQPSLVVPINMFTIDIRKLGGVIRRQHSSDVEEPMEFERITYNLQEDLVLFFFRNPTPGPGDEVTLDIDYDANVNFNNAVSATGIWKQPCIDTQVSDDTGEGNTGLLRTQRPSSAGSLVSGLWERGSCCPALRNLEPRRVLNNQSSV